MIDLRFYRSMVTGALLGMFTALILRKYGVIGGLALYTVSMAAIGMLIGGLAAWLTGPKEKARHKTTYSLDGENHERRELTRKRERRP